MEKKSVPISGNYDLILISTAHSEYTSVDFAEFNIPIIDTRNVVVGNSLLFHRA
jgi:UDP-N-acetyl-D-mannosaminuronate dehydrogenase